MGELIRALGALAEAPASGHTAIASALDLPDLPPPHAHAELFLFQVYPYASVYLGPEGMLGGEARDRVAGFWRALGEPPPSEPDHVSALLGLYSAVCDAEAGCTDGPRRALWRQSRKALLWEHLLSWMIGYADTVAEAGDEFYAAWAALLRSVLLSEASTLGESDRLPLHLREAPPLEDPRSAGGKAFLAQLLAPVRSGLFLTRADLGRCAAELGLGLRAGERRYILESLLAQQSTATLAWIASEAERWGTRHAASEAALGAVGRFWSGRARRTAGLLAELSQGLEAGALLALETDPEAPGKAGETLP